MKNLLSQIGLFVILSLCLLACTKPKSNNSSISIVSSTPVAGSKVGVQDNIIFKVKYATDVDSETPTGFMVVANFEAPNGNLYGTTNLSATQRAVTEKTGELTFTVPVSSISGASEVTYPIKAFFVLGNAINASSYTQLVVSEKISFEKKTIE